MTIEAQPILKQKMYHIDNTENTSIQNVIPAKAGIQSNWLDRIDSRLRGNDEQKG